MSNEHTPGPWQALNIGNVWIIATTTKDVHFITKFVSGSPDAKGNALLMASAPELKEKLARLERAAREDMNALDRIADLAREAHNSPGFENLLDLIINLASVSSARAALESEARNG